MKKETTKVSKFSPVIKNSPPRSEEQQRADIEMHERSQDSSWSCQYCTYKNFRPSNICDICHKTKTHVIVDEESEFLKREERENKILISKLKSMKTLKTLKVCSTVY